MSEPAPPYGDPLTAPFWEAATRHELLVQRCRACGHHQFYPRPFCLACNSADIAWVGAAGTGTIYSMTTVHMQIGPEFEPPYVVAIVELDEGPRLMSAVIGGPPCIGYRVRIAWREREGAPPLPVFRVISPPVEGAGPDGGTRAEGRHGKT